MKSFLGIVETLSTRDKTIKETSRKLNNEINLQMGDVPMKELPKKAKEFQNKIRDVSVNTCLDKREFLGIDKALQSIKVELTLNVSKLTEINKRIERETKNLEEVESDLSYSDE